MTEDQTGVDAAEAEGVGDGDADLPRFATIRQMHQVAFGVGCPQIGSAGGNALLTRETHASRLDRAARAEGVTVQPLRAGDWDLLGMRAECLSIRQHLSRIVERRR